MFPTQADAPANHRKYQFRLRYLIYLTTLMAIGFAAMRRVFDLQVGYQFDIVMFIYVFVLIAYFAVRFPILVRRMAHTRRVLKTTQAELKDFAEQARRRKPTEL